MKQYKGIKPSIRLINLFRKRQLRRLLINAEKLWIKGFLFVTFLTFTAAHSYSLELNEYSYVIDDYRDKHPNLEQIRSDLSRYATLGLSIKLEFNRESEQIQLASGDNPILFTDFVSMLLSIAEKQPTRIIPIFIEYRGPARHFADVLNYSDIFSKVLNIPQGEKWPDYQEILEQGKQFIFFTFQKNRVINANLMYIWDHVCEFPNSGLEIPSFDGYYVNGDRKNQLMLVRDFYNDRLKNISSLTLNYELNENQLYINHLLNRWKYSGKKPNFIFARDKTISLTSLIPRLNTYESIKGTVSFAGKPIENVYWSHSEKCITYGFFNLPFSEGEEMNLEPFCPGFEFSPKIITINSESPAPGPLHFEATPLSINKDISAYFPFESNWENTVNGSDVIDHGASSITNDIERGSVAKLTNKAHIEINSPEFYNIRNNSFTVSAWVKLPQLDMNKEYAILGTNETNYRKGLHLVIRNGRPYFGFFGNDLWSGERVPEMEWFHIVFRYNINNGEQAIFVNGYNGGSSLSHPSFIGDSLLIVGNCIRRNNHLNGYIDDLCIWSRPLGQDEIKKLYTNEIRPEIIESQKLKIGIYDIIFSILTLTLITILVFWLFKLKKTSAKQLIEKSMVPDDQPNSIFLFGELCITGNRGQKLNKELSPKLRELLLFIILKTLQDKKGIETRKLTQVLWPDFKPQQAANNRSVSFNKLRKALQQVEGLSLEYADGLWKAQWNNNFYCDYMEVLKILNQPELNESHRQEILFNLVKRGGFLTEYQWEWLDEFRGYISNQVIDVLLVYCKSLNRKEHSNQIKEIAQRILSVDDLHEKALHLKLNVLIEKGNVNLARFTYKQFCDNYRKAYNEIYPYDFDRFMKKFGES